MPRVFPAQFIITLAVGGIALLAVPRITLGQATSSSYNYNAIRQSGFTTTSDADEFAQAPQPPAETAPSFTMPNSIAPSTPAPNTGAVAQAPLPATPNAGSANGANQQFSLASTPNMIGDLLSGGFMFFSGGSLSAAGGDRRTKISEDSSPLPTDRVFVDYNHFGSAALTNDGRIIDVNRYTFGVEKTFFDGTCSIEFRAPVVSGLAANQMIPVGANDDEGTVLGNISITPKYLIAKSDTMALSTGVTVSLPTAPDAVLTIGPPPLEVQTVKNESIHLEPFVGLLIAPNDRLFAIGYIQLDFDANGDPTTDSFEGTTNFLGRFRDPTLMHVDIAAGYWVYDARNECRSCWALGGYVSGIAPIVELHYTTALQNFPNNNGLLQSDFMREDILNLTAGLDFQLGPMSSLTVAAAAPLRTTLRDKEFDSEIIVQFDRRF